MSKSIPADVEMFLFDLGGFPDEGGPEVFEEYARATANFLWGKYVMFEDASAQMMASSTDQLSSLYTNAQN